jgi:predicted kinase
MAEPSDTPRLIVLSGLPGTGKSAIAAALGAALPATVLSVDPIESAIVRAGIPPSFETGLAAYLVAEALADSHLAAGLSVVIDAVNSVEPARNQWRGLAGRRRATLRIIECVLHDAARLADRLAMRDRGLAIAEPTLEDVDRRRAEWTPWPEPHLTLDGARPLDVNVGEALAFVRR